MLKLNNISKTFNPGTVNEKTALSGLNLELMEVTEADVLCLVDDYGIGIRDIKSVLDYRRAKKHVIISGHEFKYLVLKNLWFHLTMSQAYLHIRDYPLDNIMY